METYIVLKNNIILKIYQTQQGRKGIETSLKNEDIIDYDEIKKVSNEFELKISDDIRMLDAGIPETGDHEAAVWSHQKGQYDVLCDWRGAVWKIDTKEVKYINDVGEEIPEGYTHFEPKFLPYEKLTETGWVEDTQLKAQYEKDQRNLQRKADLDEIDKKSVRAMRSILKAQNEGKQPSQADINKLAQCESEANTKRSEIEQ